MAQSAQDLSTRAEAAKARPAPAPAARATAGSGPITVVSGLPRSGTSMMMRMLEAGGMPVLTDGLRTADVDNPHGYYEFERVKQLDKGDHSWLPDAQGKTVKVISALLEYLPPDYDYKVIFMHRQMDEILASQKKMLAHRGTAAAGEVDDAQLRSLFAGHKARVTSWLAGQPNVHLLNVDYNRLLSDPLSQIPMINGFLSGRLDEAAMAWAIDPQLYRNRDA